MDSGTPVTTEYDNGVRFTGKIKRVRIDLLGERHIDHDTEQTCNDKTMRGKIHKQSTAAEQTASVITDLALSPNWSHSMPPGPDRHVKITKEYAKHVARDAYFWVWPLVNIYNRRFRAEKLAELAYAGPVPATPLNRMVMLTDYIDPDERIIVCPNQDVVYGQSSLGLDKSPVVIQVPDFGDRFWVYQVVDLRSDNFVQIGKMYGSTTGFYLLTGPSQS
jgi:hypothetical protein